MLNYLLIFAVALTLAIGATPVVKRIALATGTIDRPDQRKIQAEAVPLLGGISIYVASALALFIFAERFYVPQLIAIFIGATLVSFLGIWDDRWGLRPLLKLGGQTTAALILIAVGVHVEFLRQPILNYAVTIIWVVGITNALNLLDNMDGLSGGVAAIASAFFFLLAVGSGQFLVASLAAALLGACLGFLYYNFNPATIFLGDTGSLFLGYALAAVGIKLRFENTDIVTWMIPVMVLLLPIFDTTLVVVSRLRRGLNPLTNPGKDHMSHRLVALGWTQREAVMALYLVCGALGMLSLFLTKAGVVEAYLIGSAVLVIALVTLVWLERVCNGWGSKGRGD
ncbi:MAG: undecaprenyl/decaprenyl-phosphate alpha-N-acetylglucosaminyl 1-phosphate transferase [Chloroflexi bacterium]|nr:undecaprenyl/decaprenyl-phosphate alpha-N-acetylglucosaminyl 1-phosphate transferase [Chloroflexota bacterium]MCL5074034.1 undecaprenyl/decaprenyl-phosphate alpha-N-acetylglucosaminyl 1-phosphate transferase [Chloroflexota bacterium]